MAKYYTLVPLPEGPFAGLDPAARLTFGLIWERWRLSSYNVVGTPGDSPWYDFDEEAIFCVYAQEELAQQLGTTVRTVFRCLETLDAKHLIRRKKARYKGVCRYYVNSEVVKYLYAQKKDSTNGEQTP